MTNNVFGGTLNVTQPSASPAQPAASVCVTSLATQWQSLWW